MKTDWKNNEKDGKMLESAIKQCRTKAKKAADMESFTNYLRVMGYLISVKAQLLNVDLKQDYENLKKEVSEIKKTLSMAQHNTIPV